MFLRTFIIAVSLLTSASITTADSLITWSEFDDDQQNIHIFLRRLADNGSMLEQQIDNGGNNLTPSIYFDKPLIWLTWADRTNLEHYLLRYVMLSAETLQILETGEVKTLDKDVYAPSIAVAADHTPWIAWAGFDGHDEEIKLAYYDQGHWSTERNITQNETPDSTPRFETLNDGSLSLAWEETTKTEVITRRTTIVPAVQKSSIDTRFSPALVAKKVHAHQRNFDREKNLPNSLTSRRKNILMGKSIDLQK